MMRILVSTGFLILLIVLSYLVRLSATSEQEVPRMIAAACLRLLLAMIATQATCSGEERTHRRELGKSSVPRDVNGEKL
uniref:Uncharacterized protein n=1 Tax=Pristionchus pacificus TaxID=54126 RepID=A0A2A6CJY5_PRIPA|eukprot:PDM78398.1 hypothetical protein PRIPAC_30977 [Pristionchus pacificus]